MEGKYSSGKQTSNGIQIRTYKPRMKGRVNAVKSVEQRLEVFCGTILPIFSWEMSKVALEYRLRHFYGRSYHHRHR